MIVAIDFGASTVKTAVLVGSGEGELLRVGSSLEFPSAIFLTPEGVLEVGQRAVAFQRRDQLRFDARLKQRINRRTPVAPKDRVVHLGSGDSLPLLEAVTAVLRQSLDAVAGSVQDPFEQLVLTHPVDWGDEELELMTAAVRAAGFGGAVDFVSEPEGAAWFHRAQQGDLPTPAAVFDLGASTFDAAVLTGDGDRFAARFQDGRMTGGDDFDVAVLDLVARELDGTDRTRFDELRVSDRWGYDLADEARELKELLSREQEGTFAFDGLPDVPVTRDMFDDAVRPALEECVAILADAVDALPSSPSPLGSVVLSGGSSRVPLVQELVRDVAGRRGAAVLTAPDGMNPGHVVALGAVHLPQPPPPEPDPPAYSYTYTPSQVEEDPPRRASLADALEMVTPLFPAGYVARKIEENPEAIEAVRVAARAAVESQKELYRSLVRRWKK